VRGEPKWAYPRTTLADSWLFIGTVAVVLAEVAFCLLPIWV
jgi:hypothetical protein